MRRLDRFQTRVASVRMNLTPMIDMAFLLIVFFVLTSQLTNVESADEIELAQPEKPVSEAPSEDHRLVVNLIPDAVDPSLVAMVRVGYEEYVLDGAGQQRLRSSIVQAREDDPDLRVDVRADRRASYAQVYPVLEAMVGAGVSHVELVVSAANAEADLNGDGAGP